MGAALLVCRLALASVFATAGLAKLADLAGTRRAVAGFGLPEPLAALAGVALPLSELALALALIPTATARAGALAAAFLLTVFIAAIARAISRGVRPDCRCFGQLHSAPVGRRTLARNAVLLALAIWIGGAGAGDSVSTPWLVAIAAGVLALAEAALGLDLLRENRRLRARPEPPPAPGLPVGTPAPDFELEGVDGRRQMLLAGAGPWLLVFTDARCAPCDALMPALARWQQRLRLVIVASGDPERNRAEASEHGLELRLLLQREREVADAYRAPGTPMAVLVDQERHIASATVASGEAIAALVAETIGPESLTRGAGDPVPPLRLPDLDGRPRALADLCAEPTLLIFWSPGCERCQKMLLGLRTLEQELHATGPKLLLISDGDAAEIRAQGLPGTVLIDPDRRAMTEFGARGTPMSVLLADGRVASPLAAGAAGLVDLLDAVFARS